eukprot:3835712-Prymnesium_polylepis.1
MQAQHATFEGGAGVQAHRTALLQPLMPPKRKSLVEVAEPLARQCSSGSARAGSIPDGGSAASRHGRRGRRTTAMASFIVLRPSSNLPSAQLVKPDVRALPSRPADVRPCQLAGAREEGRQVQAGRSLPPAALCHGDPAQGVDVAHTARLPRGHHGDCGRHARAVRARDF